MRSAGAWIGRVHVGLPHVAGALDLVFANLLSNAIKFSERSRRIDAAIAAMDEYWRIAVCDDGLGIPAEDIPHLFARFFRARIAAGISGTGIGLHLASELVRMHEGKVFVESELGVGSTFIVILPRAELRGRIAA